MYLVQYILHVYSAFLVLFALHSHCLLPVSDCPVRAHPIYVASIHVL